MEKISEFRSRATKEEFQCLIDRILEVIDDARDNAISANTFEYRIEKALENLGRGSCKTEDGILKISICSLRYPDPEYFKIIYQPIPGTMDCLVLKFDHVYESGTIESYVPHHRQLSYPAPSMGGSFVPKTIPIETAIRLLELADRQEWHELEKILEKPMMSY